MDTSAYSSVISYESDIDGVFGEDDNDSSDYQPSDNSSDSEEEVVDKPGVYPESEDNDDDSKATTSNANEVTSSTIKLL
ncbi:hypothetical protein WA026_006666 [Henosepilachna vigintioctopunctata]|uniref:Uncharacterized protein n=1 Tax=Henosepilachna vigintioctopunctata TaxID=420089 RepID=A0AAW1UEX9_9CUCU